jgi:multiple sugar transport system substrate-binding protein
MKLNKQNRVILSLLVVLMSVCLLAGSLALAEPVTLTVWFGSWWSDGAAKLTQEFEKTHPNVKLKIDLLPINGYMDKVAAATLGGTPPDIVDLDAMFIVPLAGKNLLQPWDRYAKQLDAKDFNKGIWSSCFYKGKMYAIPERGACQVYYYNKTMFDAAGLPYPTDEWTYPDMLEMAKKLTIPGKQYGVGIAASLSDPANVFSSFAPVVWAFGGDFLNKQNTQCILNKPAGVKAIQFWTDLYTKHKVVPEGSINYSMTKDVLPMFINNKVAMFPSTSAVYMELKKYPNVKYGIVLGPDKWGRGGGWAFAMPVGVAHPNEGREFVLWFIKPENLGRLNVREPARMSAANVDPWNTPEYQQIFKAAPYMRMLPLVPQWSDMQTMIVTELQKVMQGVKTPQKAADDITAQANAMLKQKQ